MLNHGGVCFGLSWQAMALPVKGLIPTLQHLILLFKHQASSQCAMRQILLWKAFSAFVSLLLLAEGKFLTLPPQKLCC